MTLFFQLGFVHGAGLLSAKKMKGRLHAAMRIASQKNNRDHCSFVSSGTTIATRTGIVRVTILEFMERIAIT